MHNLPSAQLVQAQRKKAKVRPSPDSGDVAFTEKQAAVLREYGRCLLADSHRGHQQQDELLSRMPAGPLGHKQAMAASVMEHLSSRSGNGREFGKRTRDDDSIYEEATNLRGSH